MCELNLGNLSNEEVKSNIIRLRALERECEVDLLLHLIELEKRDLHLFWGYSSLFLYLVNALGYSEASASRRVRISRLIKQYPDIATMLRLGTTNLSCLSLVAKILETNFEIGIKLLAEISNMTCREVEVLAVVHGRGVAPRVKEFIKPIKAAKSPKAALVGTGKPTNLFCNLQESLKVEVLLPEVKSEIRYEVRCSLSQETKDKLSKAQNLMVHKLKGDVVLDKVFNELIDCYLARHSKDRKVRKIKSTKNAVVKAKVNHTKRDAIPVEIKREVYLRDNYCCSYKSESGLKCAKESNLELDHIIPVALGGDNQISNLRVVCREHNQFLARAVFGREFIGKKIRV